MTCLAHQLKEPQSANAVDRLEDGLSRKTDAAASEGAADVASAKSAANGYVEQAKNLAGSAIATAQVRYIPSRLTLFLASALTSVSPAPAVVHQQRDNADNKCGWHYERYHRRRRRAVCDRHRQGISRIRPGRCPAIHRFCVRGCPAPPREGQGHCQRYHDNHWLVRIGQAFRSTRVDRTVGVGSECRWQPIPSHHNWSSDQGWRALIVLCIVRLLLARFVRMMYSTLLLGRSNCNCTL